VIVPGGAPRTPVNDTRKIVATWVPVPLFVVTLNGSAVQAAGFVALHTAARPPGPFVLVKISGWDVTIWTLPRKTVPLLLITMGTHLLPTRLALQI
jgi:hypothetical protein